MNQSVPHRQSVEERYPSCIQNVSKERYISADWLARAWRPLWSETWQAAAHFSELERPGDFALYRIGPENILISHAPGGATKAFYNVRQHRGDRLVDVRAGTAENFRCPYHSWRNDSDGQLFHAPAVGCAS